MPLFETISSLCTIVGPAALVHQQVAAAGQVSGAVTLNTAAAPSTLRIRTGAKCIPDPEKADLAGGCGEDAYFLSSSKRTLGVSDGVGGWREQGVDSSKYSRCLMQNGKKAAEFLKEKGVWLPPVAVLDHSYNNCHEIKGSATAAVINIKGDELHGVNLGDSGFMVIRDGKSILRTKEQQTSFNAPFQLGTDSSDLPSHGDKYHVKLQAGDLVIMGTDGLWDNMWDTQILKTVNNWRANASAPNAAQVLADKLAEQANTLAHSKTARTPFEVGSAEAGRRRRGGKVDDITIVVAQVSKK